METELRTFPATIPLGPGQVFDFKLEPAASTNGVPPLLGAGTVFSSQPEVLERTSLSSRASTHLSVDTFLKRTLDIVLSLFLLLATSPLFLVVSAMVSLDGGKVYFGHNRVGRGLFPFRCLKFRTMIPNAEATLTEYLELNPDAAAEWSRDHKLTVDIRVTPVGRILRRTSLDELPQLWNVLLGDMSLVGPRPVTAQEISRYGSAIDQYAGARPGITGLWQVSGRSEITYEGRVALDSRYLATRSIWMDLSILFLQTPLVLLSRRGAL